MESGKSVRTVIHVCHFPDLPFGEITIEGTSIPKHCTTQQQRKVQDKNGSEKKRREHCSKMESVLPQKEEKKEQPKKDPIVVRGGEERTYLIAWFSLSRPAKWRDHH